MDRNAQDNFGAPGQGGGAQSATGGGYGAGAGQGSEQTTSGSAMGGASSGVGGSDAATMSESGARGDQGSQSSSQHGGQGGGQPMSDRLASGRDALQDRLGTIKERATELKATLADKLDAGADRLRQRAQQGTSGGDGSLAYAGAAGGSTDAAAGGRALDDRLNAAAGQLAGGLSSTADWLRNGDLQGDIERQVRDHPGRTLLIALGVGYLLGKSLKR